MCVLFEDLRLELNAIGADSIPKLDVLDPAGRFVETKDIGKTRRHYFLRRSIGTLTEFAEAIRWINACPEMQALKDSWGSAEATKTWNAAVAFFLTNERFIEDVRNDIGGHFGMKAAHYAVGNLDPSITGKMERHWNEDGEESMHLHFAGEIAANAFVRHLCGATVTDKVEALFRDVLMPAYGHATVAVKIIAASYLWHRFGH